jgi:hypothetical protein
MYNTVSPNNQLTVSLGCSPNLPSSVTNSTHPSKRSQPKLYPNYCFLKNANKTGVKRQQKKKLLIASKASHLINE